MNELKNEVIVNGEKIEKRIYNIRDKQVMLDVDIAELFNIETKRLNQQMSRNSERFPKDFCFKLNYKEFRFYKLQNATFNLTTKDKKRPPICLYRTRHFGTSWSTKK